MPKCIYCLESKPKDEFNKEHIVPQQLGTFMTTRIDDPITLLLTVCKQCNNFFGKKFESTLGRNSIEALYRLQYGLKRLEKFRGFDDERVKFRIPENMPAAGVILTAVPHPEGEDELVMVPPPQAGIMRGGEDTWRYYDVDDFNENNSDLPAPDEKLKFRLLAVDDAGLEEVRSVFLKRFPKAREEGKLDLSPPETADGKMLVEVKFRVDRLLARAIAKIAFNYVAFHAGATFVQKDSFDPIRRFIRYDENGENWRQFVQFLSGPLLAQETAELQITRGHILIARWKDMHTLTVSISPFNAMAYEVTLTKRFFDVAMPVKAGHLKAGHLYDWATHRISPLLAIDRIVLPAGCLDREARAYQQLVRRPKV